MPEAATPADTHDRYVELISESLLVVGEAIHTCAHAEFILKKIRETQHVLTPEEVSHAASLFRQAQVEMKKSIDDHARLEQQYMVFQEGNPR